MGNRVKELRKKKGMTLRELAKITGISKSTLSDIENNIAPISEKRLDKLSEAFGVDKNFLRGD